MQLRVDVYLHGDPGPAGQLDRIEHLLGRVLTREAKMALDITALTAEVTRQGTIADSVIAWILGHSGEPGIDQATIDALVASCKANNDRLNVAIPANTPPPTP